MEKKERGGVRGRREREEGEKVRGRARGREGRVGGGLGERIVCVTHH